MHYTYLRMNEYRFKDISPELRCWCIAIEYDEDEPKYRHFPNGTERLSGLGLEKLTELQAKEKADEINRELFGE